MTKQELSGQEVAMYLMEYEDHFTSHSFKPLFWTSFEHAIDIMDPCPECNVRDESRSSESSRPSSDDVAGEEGDILPQTVESKDIPIEHDTLYTDHEEVYVTADASGNLLHRGSLVDDYIYRGSKLQNYSLWDYVSCISKVPKKRFKK